VTRWLVANDADNITVSVASRHGRTKLHTFIRLPDPPRDKFMAGWGRATPRSHRQRAQFDRERRELNALAAQHPEHDWLAPAAAAFRPAPRQKNQPNEVLGQQRVDLGEGVNPVGFTLAVVLEALHSDGRRGVDLGDLKVVLSQLGSHITGLDTLSDEQRRHAQPALYSEILKRCTKV
jgi:hypothetical protein